MDPQSLVWQQVNRATNGDFTITKTYIADPSRSVVLADHHGLRRLGQRR